MAITIRVAIVDEPRLRMEASELMRGQFEAEEISSASVDQLVYEALVANNDGRPPVDFGLEICDYSHGMAPGAGS